MRSKAKADLRALRSFRGRFRAGNPRPKNVPPERFLNGLSNPPSQNTKRKCPDSFESGHFLVEEGGFEPPKRDAADLQSVPFGHSGTPPYLELVNGLEPLTC